MIHDLLIIILILIHLYYYFYIIYLDFMKDIHYYNSFLKIKFEKSEML